MKDVKQESAPYPTGSGGAQESSASPPDADAKPRPEGRELREGRETKDGPVPEMLRRLATLGLTGFFMTEGALRRAVGDTLPRDWIDFATAQSDRTREEVLDRITQEIGKVFQEMDLQEVIGHLLSDQTIEVKAEIRLKPKTPEDGGASS